VTPAWSLDAAGGGGGSTPQPITAPASEGLIFWVKGDAGLNSTGGFATSWEDQSGFGQDVAEDALNPGPATGLDAVDGIPCITGPLGNQPGRGLYRFHPNGLRDRNGDYFGYGAGEHQQRTILTVMLPRFSPGAFNITGGLVSEMNSTPIFQPLFNLEDNFTPNGFYLFSTGWRNPGTGALQGPDTPGGAGGVYNGVPTLGAWFSNGFNDIGVSINGVVMPLTPSVIPGPTMAGPRSFGILRGVVGGLNFQGAIAEELIYDYDLRTNPSALYQTTAYLAGRFPSIPM
jgi:hypothetical protein